MAELKGSEKQIHCADEIRKHKIEECLQRIKLLEEANQKTLESFRKKPNKLALNEIRLIKIAINVLENLDDSSKIIDFKDEAPITLGTIYEFDNRF
ncbi:hypothetical protein CLSAB_19220 [Clostridium saccharobutylicum]|uniref:hypothetical protein n=1 Tax=Clostridium saccharobutylicum TaxID=169679 RepID=UPI00098C6214|nr:hypothetical protein [Clostridium saccharobutylicum]OOM17202.1 hypothetical protein CLSAB_19220 [Clostridium saccharobutylicum]